MMPLFPCPSKIRTDGFPQYGFKVDLSLMVIDVGGGMPDALNNIYVLKSMF
jgi:hypothetical protein